MEMSKCKAKTHELMIRNWSLTVFHCFFLAESKRSFSVGRREGECWNILTYRYELFVACALWFLGNSFTTLFVLLCPYKSLGTSCWLVWIWMRTPWPLDPTTAGYTRLIMLLLYILLSHWKPHQLIGALSAVVTLMFFLCRKWRNHWWWLQTTSYWFTWY